MKHHKAGPTGLRTAGVAAIALALSAPILAAQQARTCGWDLPPGRTVPESIDQLLLRAGELDDRRAAAVQNVTSWVTECDHTAARRASMSFRNEQRRTNSTDPVLRALLAVSLVRGPDVQVLNSEGALLRAINRHTNAEIEGVRLCRPSFAKPGGQNS